MIKFEKCSAALGELCQHTLSSNNSTRWTSQLKKTKSNDHIRIIIEVVSKHGLVPVLDETIPSTGGDAGWLVRIPLSANADFLVSFDFAIGNQK